MNRRRAAENPPPRVSSPAPVPPSLVAQRLAGRFHAIGDRLRDASGLASSGLIVRAARVELCDACAALVDALSEGLLPAPDGWPEFRAQMVEDVSSHVRNRRTAPLATRPDDEFLHFVDPRPRWFTKYCARVLADMLNGPPDGFGFLYITQRHGESNARLQAQLYARGFAAACDRLADEIKLRDARDDGNSHETAPAAEPKAKRRVRRAKWLAEAMLTVQDHPEWSDAAIAKHVNIDKSQLCRSREYRAAASMARHPKIAAGSVKIIKGNRELEAVDDNASNPSRSASRQSQDEEDTDDRIDREMRESATQRRPQRGATKSPANRRSNRA